MLLHVTVHVREEIMTTMMIQDFIVAKEPIANVSFGADSRRRQIMSGSIRNARAMTEDGQATHRSLTR